MGILNLIVNFVFGFLKWFFVFCVVVTFPYLFVGSLIVISLLMIAWQNKHDAECEEK